MLSTRLKASEVGPTRERLRLANGGLCSLCKLPLPAEKAVLDHDHSTGAIRGAIHNGCNALLGKVENNYKRYGVPNPSAFLHGCADYMQRHSTNMTGLLHPTHKTPEEKRLRTNAKARARRAATKTT